MPKPGPKSILKVDPNAKYRDVLRVIIRLTVQLHRPPSNREVIAEVDRHSTTVMSWLCRMEARGWITGDVLTIGGLKTVWSITLGGAAFLEECVE